MVDAHEPLTARYDITAAAGTNMATTAAYGSSGTSVSTTAVVTVAIASAVGSEPVSRRHTGVSIAAAAASVAIANGWYTSQPCMPSTLAVRPPSQNQPMG